MQQSVVKRAVFLRITDIHSAAQHRVGSASRVKRGCLRDAVDPPRHAADDRDSQGSHPIGKASCLFPAVTGGKPGADHGRRGRFEPGKRGRTRGEKRSPAVDPEGRIRDKPEPRREAFLYYTGKKDACARKILFNAGRILFSGPENKLCSLRRMFS